MCYALSEKTKTKVKWDVDRESPGKKIADFFSRHTALLREMRHQLDLRRMLTNAPTLGRLVSSAGTGDDWKRWSFALALLINAIVLMCFQAEDPLGTSAFGISCTNKLLDRKVFDWDPATNGFTINDVIATLGAMQTLTSVMIVISFNLNYLPLIITAGKEEWRANRRRTERRTKRGGAKGGNDGGPRHVAFASSSSIRYYGVGNDAEGDLAVLPAGDAGAGGAAQGDTRRRASLKDNVSRAGRHATDDDFRDMWRVTQLLLPIRFLAGSAEFMYYCACRAVALTSPASGAHALCSLSVARACVLQLPT